MGKNTWLRRVYDITPEYGLSNSLAELSKDCHLGILLHNYSSLLKKK